MIHFLQYAGLGQRGGDAYTFRLHSYLKSKLDNISPAEFEPRPPRLNSIIRHAKSSIAVVKNSKPNMIITDISSGARNVLAVDWARKNGIKVMIVVQERRLNFRYNNFMARWLIRKCEDHLLKCSDIVLVNSNYIARYSRQKAQKAQIIVAHPGIQIKFDQNYGSSIDRAARDGINILAVGECTDPRKGTRYLIEALGNLGDLNIRLNIAGGVDKNSQAFQKIDDLVKKNNLHDKVVFYGFLPHSKLIELYKDSDIFVLPSLSEGFGMAMAEALCFGLPVVATNVAAIPEMIEDGINGILVKPKDPQALADAIRKLAGDPGLRERMRQANIEKARCLPTWDDFDNVLERELVPAIERLTGLKARKIDRET